MSLSTGASGINVAMNSSYEGAGLAHVYMPGTMFGTLASGPSPTSVGVLVTIYSTAAFFTLRGVNNSIINSPIVGVSVVVNNSIVTISGLMDPIQIDLNLTTYNTVSYDDTRIGRYFLLLHISSVCRALPTQGVSSGTMQQQVQLSMWATCLCPVTDYSP